jgi:voltage-gated potassium channel Kch
MPPLLLGVAVTFFTIIVHALIPGMIVRSVQNHVLRGRAGIWLWDVFVVMGATLLLLAAHFVEMTLWALSFILCGEFSNFAAAFYYSAATYTTVGDSTIVLSARWRLLGPIEAADGMLMFGVSTAIIFAIIHRLIQANLDLQRDPPLRAG